MFKIVAIIEEVKNINEISLLINENIIANIKQTTIIILIIVNLSFFLLFIIVKFNYLTKVLKKF